MEVSSVNSSSNYDQYSVDSNWGQMGKTDFLKLITAQLKYQDPLAPTNNSEFLSQAAQFNILEQIMNLNQRFDAAFANNLVGKEITWQNEEQEEFSGVVEKIEVMGGNYWLSVNGELVSTSQVTGISAVESSSQEQVES